MFNAQGLVTNWKIPFLNDYVKNHPSFIPVISITESWSKSYIKDAMLRIPSYNLFRCDRQSRSKGGALLYIHENIITDEVATFDNKFCEVVIAPLPKIKMCMVTLYRPPSCPFSKFTEALNFVHDYARSKGDSWYVTLNGDFNLPCINWDSFHITSGLLASERSCAESLLETISNLGLSQHVSTPTRFDPISGSANILDIFLTNHPDFVCDITVSPTLLSDHEMIEVYLSSDLKPVESKPQKYCSSSFGMLNFAKADFGRIKGYLRNVDWDDVLYECESTDSFPVAFSTILYQICYLCVPLKSNQNSIQNGPGRRLKSIRGYKRKLKKLRSRYNAIYHLNPHSTLLDQIKSEISRIKNQIKFTIDIDRSTQEKLAVDKIKANPKFFYSFAKKFSFVKSKVGTLRCPVTKSFTSDPKQMATILQKQFCSVFSDPQSPLKKRS